MNQGAEIQPNLGGLHRSPLCHRENSKYDKTTGIRKLCTHFEFMQYVGGGRGSAAAAGGPQGLRQLPNILQQYMQEAPAGQREYRWWSVLLCQNLCHWSKHILLSGGCYQGWAMIHCLSTLAQHQRHADRYNSRRRGFPFTWLTKCGGMGKPTSSSAFHVPRDD